MTAPLDPNTLRRATSVARLLASDKEGERNNALSALARMLPGDMLANVVASGLARSTVRQAHPTDAFRRWQGLARTVRASGMPLTPWEQQFLGDMARRTLRPTGPQQEQLQRLAERLSAWEGRNA